MVNYEKDVYYTKVFYDKKMHDTKIEFIKGKAEGVKTEQFKKEVDALWLNINHDYMKQTIEKLQTEIRKEDGVTLYEQRKIPNKYKLNSYGRFELEESKFRLDIIKSYANSTGNDTAYLTQLIKDFPKLERTIPYNRKDGTVTMHTPSEYLSMLYNVNLRMASWNQTIKDGQVLGIDAVKLISHPNACPTCNEHAEELYSISGKGPYPSIERAYEEGVGHPNCKCNFILWWGDMETIDRRTDLYEEVQKAQALDRKKDELRTDLELFKYIGNEEEAEKTADKLRRVRAELREIKTVYNIGEYID